MYKNSVFINMAVLCACSTTLVLGIRADLSGPVIAGILTITGFGALGKHVRNVAPVIFGAIISAHVNHYDFSVPSHAVIFLFSSGLAPISGTFGWIWGLIAGFLHVNIAMYINDLNSGLNLYNNGFAATFVVMFILPLIKITKRGFLVRQTKKSG